MIDIDRELAHVQRERLAGDIMLVIVGHGTLIALLAFLLWPNPAVRARGASWSLAVVTTTLARALWQQRARDPSVADARLVSGLRIFAALQGLAWGVGLALLVNVITEEQRAVVLIGFAGLGARATHTPVGWSAGSSFSRR